MTKQSDAPMSPATRVRYTELAQEIMDMCCGSCMSKADMAKRVMALENKLAAYGYLLADADYLVSSWGRGCDADDYSMDIQHFKTNVCRVIVK